MISVKCFIRMGRRNNTLKNTLMTAYATDRKNALWATHATCRVSCLLFTHYSLFSAPSQCDTFFPFTTFTTVIQMIFISSHKDRFSM